MGLHRSRGSSRPFPLLPSCCCLLGMTPHLRIHKPAPVAFFPLRLVVLGSGLLVAFEPSFTRSAALRRTLPRCARPSAIFASPASLLFFRDLTGGVLPLPPAIHGGGGPSWAFLNRHPWLALRSLRSLRPPRAALFGPPIARESSLRPGRGRIVRRPGRAGVLPAAFPRLSGPVAQGSRGCEQRVVPLAARRTSWGQRCSLSGSWRRANATPDKKCNQANNPNNGRKRPPETQLQTEKGKQRKKRRTTTSNSGHRPAARAAEAPRILPAGSYSSSHALIVTPSPHNAFGRVRPNAGDRCGVLPSLRVRRSSPLVTVERRWEMAKRVRKWERRRCACCSRNVVLPKIQAALICGRCYHYKRHGRQQVLRMKPELERVLKEVIRVELVHGESVGLRGRLRPCSSRTAPRTLDAPRRPPGGEGNRRLGVSPAHPSAGPHRAALRLAPEAASCRGRASCPASRAALLAASALLASSPRLSRPLRTRRPDRSPAFQRRRRRD